ncbi:MAG TPA: hypothetical protein VGM94_00915 [Galbitalea sp.]
MKRRSVRDDLTDGFTPSPLPPLGPDGSLLFTDSQTQGSPRLAPRMCEQGPCVHYHRLETQLDAETPRDGSDGGLHVQVHHTCYPQSGIEFELGDTPVVACNLWLPTSATLEKRRKAERDRHLKSKSGKQFLKDMNAWQVARADAARVAEEVAAAQRELLAAELAARDPEITNGEAPPTAELGPFGDPP